MHPRVDETPANRAISDVGRSAVPGSTPLQHHVRRPGHALHASRQEEVALAGPNGVGRGGHRLKAGSAETVHRLTRDLHR